MSSENKNQSQILDSRYWMLDVISTEGPFVSGHSVEVFLNPGGNRYAFPPKQDGTARIRPWSLWPDFSSVLCNHIEDE